MAKKMICTTCQTIAKPIMKTKGSILIEFILWLCFIIPGLIYSIWRGGSRYKACRNCGSTAIVPLDSPIGIQLQSQ